MRSGTGLSRACPPISGGQLLLQLTTCSPPERACVESSTPPPSCPGGSGLSRAGSEALRLSDSGGDLHPVDEGLSFYLCLHVRRCGLFVLSCNSLRAVLPRYFL